MNRQSGLFDEEMRLRKLSELGDSLEKLGCIDWEMFRPIIRSAFDKKGKSNAGRPPFDYVMMFKILVLQRFYNISDDQTEYMINDRMSFQRFLGLTLADKVPDAVVSTGAATGITINNAPTKALFVNSTGTLTATVSPDNVTDKTVTWSSSDPDYVSINAETGEYTIMGTKGYGSATITATAGDKTATCVITGKVTYTSATIGVNTIFHVGDTYYADGTTKYFSATSNFTFTNTAGVITLIEEDGKYKFKRGSKGTVVVLGDVSTNSDGVYIKSGSGTSDARFEIAVHTTN